MSEALARFTLDVRSTPDLTLQSQLEAIDARLRARHGLAPEEAAVGVLDLQSPRVAMVRPDAIDYAASVPKIGILLAWFQVHADEGGLVDAPTRHAFGLMIKQSNNEIAANFSQQLGLKRIQAVLDSYGLYDAAHGGGLWVGKHYGKSDERHLDPVGKHSHAATVRQLLRFYLLLEQGRLVSPAASRTMRGIFASPDIPHVNDKFVKGLAERDVEVLRKAGWWETWAHDTAIVSGPGRHYIVVALTHHAHGDAFLEEFAAAVDDLMKRAAAPTSAGR